MTEKIFTLSEKIDKESFLEISNELKESLKLFRVIKVCASIPDKIIMGRIEKFCRGISAIPEIKREKYAIEVGKKGLNRDSVFIISLLNRMEDEAKIPYFVKLFRAKVYFEIDDTSYRRMMILVDRTLYSDILYMLDNIISESFALDSDEKQGLYLGGWLLYNGATWGSFKEKGSFNYRYSDTAFKFCKIMKDTPSSDETIINN